MDDTENSGGIALPQIAPIHWEYLEPQQQKAFIDSQSSRNIANVEAEQALLGRILLQNETVFDIGRLQSEHFAYPVHQVIFDDMLSLIKAGSAATPITMRPLYDQDEMLSEVGGSKYLAQIAAIGETVLDPMFYAHAIYDLAARRQMFDVLEKMKAELTDPRNIAVLGSQIKYKFITKLMDIEDDAKARRIETWDEVTSKVVEDLERDIHPDSTGIAVLDDALSGGLFQRKLYDFNAPMKKGKTMLMTTIFTNVVLAYQKEFADELFIYENGHRETPPAHPRRALYICAEMGAPEIHQRIMARLAGYNAMAFYRKSNNSDFKKAIYHMREKKQKQPGLFYDARGLRFDELKYIMTIAVRRYNVTGVFLDYFALVEPDGVKYENTIKFQEKVASWMHAFLKEHDIWCVTANQINREGNIRGGDALKMNADYVGTLDSDDDTHEAWITTTECRYSYKKNVGTRGSPALKIMKEGPYFADKEDISDIPSQFNYHQSNMDLEGASKL